MINTEFFKPANIVAISLIVLAWLAIHDRFLKHTIEGKQ